MDDEPLFKGFRHDFLVDDKIKQEVPFPSLKKKRQTELAPVKYNDGLNIDYLNYSVQLSGSRKFPIFTASNIDGKLFKAAPRPKSWRIDERVKQYQWGKDLYEAEKSDFDKGHMTRREDVQWGETLDLAKKAAYSTFYYTNAVPQHKDLNQEIWKNLEDYILHAETTKRSMKVCVFTGPVLSNDDPEFVTAVNGEKIKLPTIFWKVVIYPGKDGKLHRVGFLMSQKKLLTEKGIIRPSFKAAPAAGEKVFTEFDDAETYQVNISLIERLTDLKMPKAVDSYKDDRSRKLVLEEIEVKPEVKPEFTPANLPKQRPGYTIKNIVL
jgi:endonuclease G